MDESKVTYRSKAVRLSHQMRNDIQTGRFEGGSLLPTFKELTARYQASEPTVRRAIQILADEEHLIKLPRRGLQVPYGGNRTVTRSTSPDRTTTAIGMICPSKLGEFGTELLHRLHHQAEDRNMRINFRTVSDYGLAARDAARELVDQGCRIILHPLVPPSVSADHLWELIRPLPVPVVLNRVFAGLERFCYEPKEIHGRATFAAIEMACRYFKELGYGHIAFFAEDQREEDLQRRILAYSRFASRHGLATHIALIGPRADEVDAVVERWSEMAGNLAVVCCGDEDALRLMTSLHKRSLRIPGDFAVLGFKNTPLSATCDPPLSTIQFDYDYVARAMLNHAEALMTGETDRTTEGPKQQLIVRDSCGGRIRAGDRLESIVTEVERSSWEAKAGGNL